MYLHNWRSQPVRQRSKPNWKPMDKQRDKWMEHQTGRWMADWLGMYRTIDTYLCKRKFYPKISLLTVLHKTFDHNKTTFLWVGKMYKNLEFLFFQTWLNFHLIFEQDMIKNSGILVYEKLFTQNLFRFARFIML